MGNIMDAFYDAIELDHLDDEMLKALEEMFADLPYPVYQD
jgi:hypothetical protein